MRADAYRHRALSSLSYLLLPSSKFLARGMSFLFRKKDYPVWKNQPFADTETSINTSRLGSGDSLSGTLASNSSRAWETAPSTYSNAVKTQAFVGDLYFYADYRVTATLKSHCEHGINSIFRIGWSMKAFHAQHSCIECMSREREAF